MYICTSINYVIIHNKQSARFFKGNKQLEQYYSREAVKKAKKLTPNTLYEMQNGKMVVISSGTQSAMIKDVLLKDGVKIQINGFVIEKDGSKINADLNGSLNIGRKVIHDYVVDRSLVARPLRITPYKHNFL